MSIRNRKGHNDLLLEEKAAIKGAGEGDGKEETLNLTLTSTLTVTQMFYPYWKINNQYPKQSKKAKPGTA